MPVQRQCACFRIVNSSDMSTLRGSKNYVWDTAKPLGQGATSLVYVGREKVRVLAIAFSQCPSGCMLTGNSWYFTC